MIDALKSKKCSACTACAEACPVNAISMIKDEEGFSYPTVDMEKCIDCGKCDKVCPSITPPGFNNEPDVYALQNKNSEVLRKSQSGGAFFAIAEEIFSRGGVVYGAAFDEQHRVVHKRAASREEASCFHGSKYVQTDMSDMLPKIKEDLKNGIPVLFSGTACHVAGVYSYLGKKYENFYTCDLICHGVPSPLLYEKYIQYIENKHKSKVKKFAFGYYDADEGYSWDMPRCEHVDFEDNTSMRNNEYMRCFVSNAFLRPYCYQCPYASTLRISDFTIGDFWGAEKYLKEFEFAKGISVVFANSEKAKCIIEGIGTSAKIQRIELNDVVRHQHNLSHPCTPNKRRALIFRKLINKGFLAAYKKERFYYRLYCLKQKLLGGR